MIVNIISFCVIFCSFLTENKKTELIWAVICGNLVILHNCKRFALYLRITDYNMIGIKRCIMLFILVFTICNVNATPFVVVIDAGHGGKDVGALGSKVREKDVNLAVALKFGKMIESKLKDVKVVYTRSTDKYLTLQERAQIANKSKGNLFISLHCNSLDKRNKKRKTIRGASTYTLGLHKSDDNLEVAMRENSVIALEKDYAVTYQGFDPNSTESYIIFEISQNAHMEQSVDFASRIQKEFVSTAGRVDRGVKQAGFLVLARTSMTAVLVELDFICNPTQEKFLGSEKGQKKMAEALYNAFYDYKMSVDSKIAAVSKKENHLIDKSEDVKEHPKASVETTVEDETKADELVYKIQFMTSVESIQQNDSRMKGLSPIDKYQEHGLYKYTYGAVTSQKEAQKLLNQVKKKFKGAFIVTFKNGIRIK